MTMPAWMTAAAGNGEVGSSVAGQNGSTSSQFAAASSTAPSTDVSSLSNGTAPPALAPPRALPLPTPSVPPGTTVIPGMTVVPNLATPSVPGVPPVIPGVPGVPFGMPLPNFPGMMPPMGMPGFVPPPGFPRPMGIPGMPLPPRMPFLPPPRASGGGNNERATDPANDASCWAEHKSEHGRRYWYNVVTQTSTYDKPLCLKTPEERAIPPCPWKEYANSDGKVYYSNGTDSKWDMPEEYRIWKEKVEAAEKRLPDPTHSLNRSASSSNVGAAQGHGSGSGSNNQKVSAQSTPKVTYATPAEAMEAFKDMLQHHHITSTAKFKEVQDVCGADPRWEALKTMGEKRQAVAEYQTKRVKAEKEEAKQKAKKHREAFLRMLAEHTDIDARTRWRQAQEMLKDDARFKNVEESREREDLFQEFIAELEKKEREDRHKHKERALLIVNDIFNRMREPASGNNGGNATVHAQSTWGEHRDTLLSLLQRPDLRALDDGDIKRAFLDFVQKLQEEAKQEEKRKREQWQRDVDDCERQLLTWLVTSAQAGLFVKKPSTTTPANTSSSSSSSSSNNNNTSNHQHHSQSHSTTPYDMRYKEVMHAPTVTESPPYTRLQALFQQQATQSSMPAVEACNRRLHVVFDKAMDALQESYRQDKKLVKKVFHVVLHPQFGSTLSSAVGPAITTGSSSSHHRGDDYYRVEHDSRFDDVYQRLLKYAKLRDTGLTAGTVSTEEGSTGGEGSTAAKSLVLPTADDVAGWKARVLEPAVDPREDGEEVEETATTGASNQHAAATESTHQRHQNRRRSRSRSRRSPSPRSNGRGKDGQPTTSSSSSSVAVASMVGVTVWPVTPGSMRKLFTERAWLVRFIFDEQLEKAKDEYEEELRYRRKAEEKFVQLLRDTFYLSDHVHLPWEEAKSMIQHRSAYEALTKSDRRRLFAVHMSDLQEKYAARTQALKAAALELPSAAGKVSFAHNI